MIVVIVICSILITGCGAAKQVELLESIVAEKERIITGLEEQDHRFVKKKIYPMIEFRYKFCLH